MLDPDLDRSRLGKHEFTRKDLNSRAPIPESFQPSLSKWLDQLHVDLGIRSMALGSSGLSL